MEYALFKKMAKQNETFERVPSFDELKAAGCGITDIGYLVAPNGSQFNPSSVGISILPEEIQDMFRKEESLFEKKTYTNAEVADLLGLKPEYMTLLRQNIKMNVRGPIKPADFAKMGVYVMGLPDDDVSFAESDTPELEPMAQKKPDIEESEPAPVVNDTSETENEPAQDDIEPIPATLEDDELVTVTIGQIRELVSMVKGKMPRRAGTMELFYAAGA